MGKQTIAIGTLTALVVVLGGMLASSIVQRKFETKIIQSPSASIPQFETRNSQWGKPYPHQWDSYMEAMQEGDVSTLVTDELAINPKLVVLWAGYGFSKDYNKPRGHNYSVVDTVNSLRTGHPKDENTGPMPATCMTCKSPDVPRLMDKEGVSGFYKGKWARHVKEVVNPTGCGDCHNSETMALQITRPALVEALERQGKKITDASHQEMRSLVCAQCHVEYYFQKDGAYLTFPWDKGTTAEDMEAYYDNIAFSDWTHSVSKAPMLKAQHPGYEIFAHGIHGKRNVACADCHMPYKTVGGTKFSDHHLQSPLQNVANACQQCHRTSEAELLQNVADLKRKVEDLKALSEEEIVRTHFEAKKAWDLGATEEEMGPALQLIRHAQWRWDFAVAAHGAYFHAPEEVLRTLGTAIHKAGQARSLLQKILYSKGFTEEVEIPDISTKAKAQAVIGLDEPELRRKKVEFINSIAKPWWKESPVRDQAFMEIIEKELRQE